MRIATRGSLPRSAFLALAALFVSAAPAHVHPHVFAEARLDVLVNPDQTVKSLRHLWRFDARTGRPHFPEGYTPVTRYPVMLEGGQIFVRVR